MSLSLSRRQSAAGEHLLFAWVVLAAVSALLIGTEAIIRARKLHRSMADRLLSATLQRFLPTAMAGAIIGLVVLTKAPEFSPFLPGTWQLLMGIGIFAVQGSLPRNIVFAAAFYFLCGTICLALVNEAAVAVPWLMGLPFGIGQLLVALLLHLGSKDTNHA